MPAIQPARLKKQAAQLAENFERPDTFIRSLHQLMGYYAERVQRQGQSGEPAPMLTAYKVRRPVLRQIQQDLTPFAESEPTKAIALCDALWEQPYLEFRLLVSSLIGQIPPTPPELIIDRIRSWSVNESEDRLITALLSEGTSRLRSEHMELVLALVQGWVNETDVHQQRLGLKALIPIVVDLNYENLPLLYRIIHPFTLTAPQELRLDLLELLRALTRRSPQETAYFLRQNLSHPDSMDTAWLIRQIVDEFPDDLQDDLRNAVRGFK